MHTMQFIAIIVNNYLRNINIKNINIKQITDTNIFNHSLNSAQLFCPFSTNLSEIPG